MKYSQSLLLKEKEVDVFKYFCEFVQSLDSSDAAEGLCICGLFEYCFTFFIKLNHSLSTSLIFDLGNSLNSNNCFSLLSSCALYV